MGEHCDALEEPFPTERLLLPALAARSRQAAPRDGPDAGPTANIVPKIARPPDGLVVDGGEKVMSYLAEDEERRRRQVREDLVERLDREEEEWPVASVSLVLIQTSQEGQSSGMYDSTPPRASCPAPVEPTSSSSSLSPPASLPTELSRSQGFLGVASSSRFGRRLLALRPSEAGGRCGSSLSSSAVMQLASLLESTQTMIQKAYCLQMKRIIYQPFLKGEGE